MGYFVHEPFAKLLDKHFQYPADVADMLVNALFLSAHIAYVFVASVPELYDSARLVVALPEIPNLAEGYFAALRFDSGYIANRTLVESH